MSTSGDGTLNAVLYVIMLVCSVQAGLAVLGTGAGQLLRHPPVAAALLWLTVAVPSLLQFLFPGLLQSLERNPALIRGHGQLWRLVTSVVVQDGGAAGTVFNLVTLALIGVIAVRAWGGAYAWLIFVAAAVAFNLAATFASPSTGAGNSAGTFALGTSLTGLALVLRRERSVVMLAGLAAACGIGLLALRDAHGEAVLGGLVIGLLVSSAWPPATVLQARGNGSAEAATGMEKG